MPSSPARGRMDEVLATSWSLERAISTTKPEHACAYCANESLLGGEVHAGSARGSSIREPLLGPPNAEEDRTPADAPVKLAAEAIGLLRLAAPLLVDNLSGMGLSFLTTSFVGHLNRPLDLSAMVLATSVYNITGLSVVSGLASAMETLAGQAYGAANYPMLGVVLQRATLACMLVCLPIIGLWSQIGWVLPRLGQDPEVARLAAQYLHWLMPGVVLTAFGETTLHYLLAQRVALPSMAANLLTLALAPLLNWFFIYRLGRGLNGAGAAVLCATGLVAVLLVTYRILRDACMLAGSPKQTWFGLSWAALSGWPQYLAFGLPAVLMVCVEWWLWECIILLAGMLPNGGEAVGVAGLAIQIAIMPYMVSYAVGTACSTRVANALGAGHAHRAKSIYRIALAIIFAATLVMASGVALGQDALVHLFTEESQIIAMTKTVLPVVAVGILADGQVAVLNGVLRASGRQLLGAGLHAAVMWGLGLPLAWLLGFRVGWGVRGMWIALVACTSLQALIFHTVMLLCDWEEEVRRAAVLTAADGDFAYEGSQASSSTVDGHGQQWCGNGHGPPSDLEQPLLQGEQFKGQQGKAGHGVGLAAGTVQADGAAAHSPNMRQHSALYDKATAD